mgnify:FL=1
MRKIAMLVKTLTNGWTGDAKLYKLSEPMQYGYDEPESETQFVIVSATNAMFSGPETYIFPADEDGNVIDWGELDGSYRGGYNHWEALERAGYTVAESEPA